MNKKTKRDSLFPSHLLTNQQEVSKSSYRQCNMDCTNLIFATTEASEVKPTVHQYYNLHWTLTHDSTPVFQAKRLEIWQDKKWVSSAEKLQPCVHQNTKILHYECLGSKAGTVFNTYPSSLILKFLIHYYFLNVIPSF